MSDKILTLTLTPPSVDKREILRYAGGRGEGSDLPLEECLSLLLPGLCYRICYTVLPLSQFSTKIRQALSPCPYALAFAATIGLAPDRLIARYATISPVKALLLDAIGNERVEALCDSFEEKIRTKAQGARRRVSPGYGNLPLALQEELFRLLEPAKHIGLTLGGGLLMSPAKSVTALIGLESIGDDV